MAANQATDTIAAIATAPGTGGIGIIRISGPQAPAILSRIFLPHKPPLSYFASHKLYYGTVTSLQGQIIDEALAVHMHAPHTYTREDVVELHCHGSYLILQDILQLIFQLGAKAAEPGEFTKRAFLAGRIDLTQAEAVLDLLQAQTKTAARLAANHLQGELFRQLEDIRQALIAILALLEVAIDFPDDEGDIFDAAQLDLQLQHSVLEPLQHLIRLADQGKILRQGIKVVIAGRPNVGKSSLLNALLKEERALVTSHPGTTRDTIEESLIIRGIPIHLIDTAGIRKHENPIEAMGIERARQKLDQADLVLFLIDAAVGFGPLDGEIYETIKDKKHLIVINKRELVTSDQLKALADAFAGMPVATISAKEHSGLEALEEILFQTVIGEREGLNEQMTCAPNTRHLTALIQTEGAARRFQEALKAGFTVDLLAIELQSALDYLGDIIGLTTPDEVLEAVFSKFCIGK